MAEISGLKLIVPSSVDGSGVSVSASGKVTFTAATSVSVNGVFDSTYDNYLMVVSGVGTNTGSYPLLLRAGGTDDTTANSYTRQYLLGENTTVNGGRNSNTYFSDGLFLSQVDKGGLHGYFYGPALTQPTAYRSVTAAQANAGGALIFDIAGTHNQSTAYDGFTINITTGSLTGSLTIYGLTK